MVQLLCLFTDIATCRLNWSRCRYSETLMLETFLKLGKLQCRFNFNRNEVLLLNLDNFEPNQ